MKELFITFKNKLTIEPISFSFILVLISITLNLHVGAQTNFDAYKTLKCEGKIPNSFLTASSEKAENDISNINKNENRSNKKSKKSFYIQSNFLIDNFLISGKVLFGDKLSNYIRSVAKEVMKNDKSTFNKLKFFAVKSPAVNAFATEQGYIFINIGLLAKLESEAELAFILSHEISHFKEGHVLDSYINGEELRKTYSKGKSVSYDEILLQKSNYSIDKEMEADELGFEIFKESNYNQYATINVFQKLRDADLPFISPVFDTDFVGSSNYYIDDFEYAYEAENEDEEEDRDKDEKELETHPQIEDRIEQLEDKLISGGKNFIISERTFNEIQKISRYELSELLYDSGLYEYCIYNNYLLTTEYGSGKYIEKLTAFSLAKLTKIKNEGLAREVAYDQVPDQIGKVYFLFDKMEEKDLTLLATNYTNFALNSNEEDLALNELFEDNLFEVTSHFEKYDYFENDPEFNLHKQRSFSNNYSKQEVTEEDIDNLSLEELERKLIALEYELDNPDEFQDDNTSLKVDDTDEITFNVKHKYALSELLEDEEFEDAFEKALKYRNKYDDYIEELESGKNRRKMRSKGGYGLGVEKILLINGEFLKFKSKGKGSKFLFKESEEARLAYKEQISKVANKIGLRIETFDLKDLKSSDVKKFNDVSQLNLFVQERNTISFIPMVSYRKNEMQDLSKRFGTEYISFTGGVEFRNLLGERDGLFSIFSGNWIFEILRLFNRSKRSVIYSVVYNINDNSLDFSSVRSFKYRYAQTYIKSHIYDVYKQIHQKNKKKKR